MRAGLHGAAAVATCERIPDRVESGDRILSSAGPSLRAIPAKRVRNVSDFQ